MRPSIPAADINRLGRRLARSSAPAREDLELLAHLQAEYQEAALPLARSLSELVAAWNRHDPSPNLTVNSRAKTAGTIIEKVRRGTRLSTMQDIIGFRVSAGAGPFSYGDQDRFVSDLASKLESCKIVDRRASPSHGYRAVHVIADVDGFPLEVQVRTYFQDAWANQMEALADEWGRGIRYGLPPAGDDPRQIAERLRVIALNDIVSDRIHEFELAIQHALSTISSEAIAAGLKTREEVAAHTDSRVPELLEPAAKALTDALIAFNEARRDVTWTP